MQRYPAAKADMADRVVRSLHKRGVWRDAHAGLFDGAQRAVARAFKSRDVSDWEAFVLHAAMAMELLAKAVLAHINPLLILDARATHAARVVVVRGRFLDESAALRTVSLDEALKLLAELGVDTGLEDNDRQALRGARNAIAHMGVDDEDLAKGIGRAWARSLDVLTASVPFGADELFGAWNVVAKQMIAEFDTEVARLYGERIAAAEVRWSVLQSGGVADTLAQRLEYVAAQLAHERRTDAYLHTVACPVCGSPARVRWWVNDFYAGELEAEEWEPEPRLSELDCEICELRLDSASLVEQSQVGDSFDPSAKEVERVILEQERHAEEMAAEHYEEHGF